MSTPVKAADIVAMAIPIQNHSNLKTAKEMIAMNSRQ
jgi:hypothetical protein